MLILNLKETCINKTVTFSDEVSILCKDVKFGDDDGNCWLEFIDSKDKIHIVEGQGIDIWFDIE